MWQVTRDTWHVTHDTSIKEWAGYNRKRPPAEGQLSLVNCFCAKGGGPRSDLPNLTQAREYGIIRLTMVWMAILQILPIYNYPTELFEGLVSYYNTTLSLFVIFIVCYLYPKHCKAEQNCFTIMTTKQCSKDGINIKLHDNLPTSPKTKDILGKRINISQCPFCQIPVHCKM